MHNGSHSAASSPMLQPFRLLRGRWRVVVACALVLLAGCSVGLSSDDIDSAPASTLPITQTPEYIASNTPCPAGLSELDAEPVSQAVRSVSVTLTPFITLPNTTVLVFDGDQDGERLGGWVGDRVGRIWRFEVSPSETSTNGNVNEAWVADAAGYVQLSAVAQVDLSSDTAAEHDQGLVGMTVGPWGNVWINRTKGNGNSIVSVLEVASNGAERKLTGAVTDLLEVKQPSAQHNGGDLLFDDQNRLYVSFGDGGGQGDPRHHGQNLASPLGAILRFDINTGGSEIPSDWTLQPAQDNPDFGDGSDPSIWVYGVRNPYRMSLDPATDTLWVADVGQQCVEEVTVLSLAEGGANLGWNAYEGSRRFFGDDVANHRVPDFEYRHGLGLCVVSGGHVYVGSALDWLVGRYVFADLCGGDVYAVDVAAGTAVDDVWHLGVSAPRPVGFATDAAGELYVIDLETGVFRIDPAT